MWPFTCAVYNTRAAVCRTGKGATRPVFSACRQDNSSAGKSTHDVVQIHLSAISAASPGV